MMRRSFGQALLIALAAIVVLAGWELRDVTTVAPPQTGTLVLSASRPAVQQFAGAYTGLQAIDVLMEPSSLGAHTLILELYDEQGQLLRAASAQPPAAGPAWVTFRFPEVTAARGQTFTFRLIAPDSAYRDGLAVWQSAAPLPGHGRLLLGTEAARASLVYRPHYRPTALELLLVYAQRLAQAQHGALASPAVYLGLVAVYLLALAAIAVLVGRFAHAHLHGGRAPADE